MSLRAINRRALVLVAAAVAVVMMAVPTPASAHSLDSSTVAVRIDDGSVEATVSFAIETLDQALGTDYLDDANLDDYADDVIAYLDDHLTVTDADGNEWTATYSDPMRESVEGIESFSVEVTFDTGNSDVSRFTLTYSAIIESVTDHEAVVVLTDSDGHISTVGVIDGEHDTVTIADGDAPIPRGDMLRYGIDHVLDGADHLLFLTTLLLPAPLVVGAGRWRKTSGGPLPTLGKVVHVVTAFTVGHSVTLIASALGWVTVPSRPVEVLVAASVAVSAIHAIRPIATHGEPVIAVGFGLVHGLAFAGILDSLGVTGTTSVLTLLAFNIGVEVAQLATAALIFPSLYVISRTRFYAVFRVAGAGIALGAASGWMLDRLGIFSNPFAGIEDAAIGHPWPIVIGLAALAALAQTADRLRADPTQDEATPRALTAYIDGNARRVR